MTIPAKGFSLAEMAIVLVVLGFIVTVLVPPIVRGVQHEKQQDGKDQLRAVQHGILGSFMENKRLPGNIADFPTEGIGPTRDVWDRGYVYRLATFNSTDLCANTTDYSAPLRIEINGTIRDAAFLIASYGQNHDNGTGINYNATPIDLNDPQDDLVEFMSLEELRYSCPAP